MEISMKLKKARQYESEQSKKINQAEKPVFHMSVPVGWMNDPNGFSMFRGICHLFFQYHPYDTTWGPMHWGHCTTNDFIQWEIQPCALAPDMEYDKDGCFSGTALEWNGQHVLMYTGVNETKEKGKKTSVKQTQCIAFGNGTDYCKIEKNPVIDVDLLPKGSSACDFRDPKIWKDEKGFWALVGSLNEDGSGQLALFHSANLIDWKFIKMLDYCRNEYGKMWECPDFFSLDGRQVLLVSPQFMMTDGKEFHNGNNSIYFVGDYDKETLDWKRDTPHMVDFGMDFYAPQTLEYKDGRRIMIAWLQSWDSYMAPESYQWIGTATIPRELEVKNGRLIQNPVRELKNYRKNQVLWGAYELYKWDGMVQIPDVKGRCLDLIVSLSGEEYQTFSIYMAANEIYHTVLRYEREKGVITMDRTFCGMRRDYITTRSMKIEQEDTKSIYLRILLDKNSIELFVNHGEYAMSTLIYTPLQAEQIYFETDGSVKMDIEKYDIIVKKE